MENTNQKLNIAISGAGGYVGENLVSYFLNKTDYNLILNYWDEQSIPECVVGNKARCEIIVGDFGNKDICLKVFKNADVLIHLAQRVNPDINFGSWQEACKNSCDSTFVLFDLLRTWKKPLHILYPSSGGTVYSHKNPEDRTPFREDFTTRPVSPYGIQKVMFENHFSLLNSVNPNITTNILRISNPYGTIISSGRAQGFIGIAAGRIKNSEIINIWGDINSIRDYIHFNDLNKAFEAALLHKDGFQVFNIGTGKGTSLKQIIDLFSQNLKKDVNYKILEPKSENYFPKWNVLDISRANTHLKWRPEIKIEEGIKNVAEKI